jgi:hypothetical protein
MKHTQQQAVAAAYAYRHTEQDVLLVRAFYVTKTQMILLLWLSSRVFHVLSSG